LEPTRELASQV
jgi:superfamily II DNA/RNA helicase